MNTTAGWKRPLLATPPFPWPVANGNELTICHFISCQATKNSTHQNITGTSGSKVQHAIFPRRSDAIRSRNRSTLALSVKHWSAGGHGSAAVPRRIAPLKKVDGFCWLVLALAPNPVGGSLNAGLGRTVFHDIGRQRALERSTNGTRRR
jgi:hypothetical protein